MADPRSNAQMFDIDTSALLQLQKQFGATQDQMLMAYNRALKRTAKHMHRVSVSMLMAGLAAKKRKYVDKRVKDFLIRRNSSKEKIGDMSCVKLWYGLDDFRVYQLRGSMRDAPKKKPAHDSENGEFIKKKRGQPGATFVSKAKGLASTTFEDSFVGERYGYNSIWIKIPRGGVKEGRVSVHEALEEAIDEYIFENIGPVFMRYYEQDLKGRVAGGIK